MEQERLLLRIGEAAQALGVSKSTAYNMAAQGELPTIRIRGGLRVPADALKAWIVEKMNTAARVVTTEAGAAAHSRRRDGKCKLGGV